MRHLLYPVLLVSALAGPAQADGDKLNALVTGLKATCDSGDLGEGEDHTITIEPTETDSRQAYRIVQVPCYRGAYNTAELWVIGDTYGDVSVLSFATPEIDVVYSDGEAQEQVTSIKIQGYTSATQLGNSFFDPKSMTFTSFHKWRGVGDASQSGTWKLRDGRAFLIGFQVDASYDGEINPIELVAPPKE